MQESGLEQVFLAHRPQLLRFVRARLGGGEGTEDCLQEAWIKIATLDSGPIAEPLAYLYRMLANIIVDRRRSGRDRARREEAWTDTQSAAGPGIDAAPSAERHLLDRERLRAVERALAALPPRTVHVFRQARLEGVPQKRIAAELGISVSAIEKHLMRAMRAVLEGQLRLDEGFAPGQRPDRGNEDHAAER